MRLAIKTTGANNLLCRVRPGFIRLAQSNKMQTHAVERLVTENGRRSIETLLRPLRQSPGLKSDFLGAFDIGGEKYFIPRFSFFGPNSADAIRIGIFAAIHGDEPSG